MNSQAKRFVWAHPACVCVYDPEAKVGALAPLRPSDRGAVLEALVRYVLDRGGTRDGLVARVYGEGEMVQETCAQLSSLDIPLKARSGALAPPLQVKFDPETGEARALSLRPDDGR